MLFFLRYMLRKETIVSIHDVVPHKGRLYLRTFLANKVIFILANNICVYSSVSKNALINMGYKKKIYLFPLEGFRYGY